MTDEPILLLSDCAPRPVNADESEPTVITASASVDRHAPVRGSFLTRCPTCGAVVRRIRIVADAADPAGGDRLIDHVQTPVYVAIGEAGRERWRRELAAGVDHRATCRGATP